MRMPRCYLLGDEVYRSKDLCRQIMLICKEEKVSQRKLGDALGITQARMSQKLRAGDLDVVDLLKILKVLAMKVVMEEGRIKIERITKDGISVCNTLEY